MADQLARYTLDDGTPVVFEIAPAPGYRPAGAADVLSQVRAAVTPALEAARVVIEKARSTAPDEVEVKFGIKVSGEANWWIAKAATEGNFEITLKWNGESTQP
jgi:hypothetical protein